MHKYYISKDGKTFKRLPKNSKGYFAVPEGVEVIGRRAFAGCEGLTSVTLPMTLKVIGDEAFEGCSNLGAIILPEGVETIGKKAFANCRGLTEINLPNTLKELGEEAYYCCSRLKRIEIPERITKIPDECFFGCAITEIRFPDSLEEIGSMAFALCSLSAIEVGPNVTTVGWFAFQGNRAETLHLGKSVRAIGKQAFLCTELKTIEVDAQNELFTDAGCNVLMEKETGRVLLGSANSVIPDNAKVITSDSFSTEAVPQVLVIPSSVETIEAGAFSGFGKSIIVLNKGVQTIQECAFMPCGSGTITVYLPSTVSSMGAQCSSVEFHLDAANQHFSYDAAGKNIISKDGDLIWGRLEEGIPSEGVVNVSVILDKKLSYPELIVPSSIKSISRYIFGLLPFKANGLEKLVLNKGTKMDSPPRWGKMPCEIEVIIPRKKGSAGLLKNTKYIIPAGTSTEDIDVFLGNDTIFM